MKQKSKSTAAVQFQGMVTVAPCMKSFFEIVKRVAATESAILIRGESGTGKELVARAIHNMGRRSQGEFHGVNCATLTPELAASELFGHERGAFTGAVSTHHGLFKAAHGGTLFLDEIAELPLAVQPRLLRAIQEHAFTPVGSTKTVRSDARILSATHKALRHEVEEGRFREDLMYRIRVVPIFLPRLADRRGDVELLCHRLITEFNRISARKITAIAPQAWEALLSYDWPGNVRELRNNIEYAFAVGEGEILGLADLPPELRGEAPPEAKEPAGYAHEEREQMRLALIQARGRKGEAAAALGMSRSTFWRKAREFGLT